MSSPEIRYATTDDGVRIAYSVEGHGAAIIVCPFFIESFALDSLVPEVAVFLKSLGRGRKLVRYDSRGTGLSDRNPDSNQGPIFGQRALLSDLSSVAEACGVDSFAIFASGTCGPVVIEYAATHPERVSHLILCNTFSSPQASTPGGRPWDQSAADALASLCESNWPLAAQTFADMTLRQEFPEAALRWSEVFRRSASGETVARGLRNGDFGVDRFPFLRKIAAPTLVFHRLEGGIAPFEEGQRMARAVNGARFVPLRGTAAHYSLGDTQPILDAVDAFLGDRTATAEGHQLARHEPGSESLRKDPGRAPPNSMQGTATILFADIADSTGLTERMGDAAFRAKSRDLDAKLRTVIRNAGGSAIEGKVLGDGVMAVFASARQAVECALRCNTATDGSGLQLHLGVHAGDVINEGSNVFGGAVNVAARIAGESAPGEVLVSDVVRALARTSSDVTFEDRGEIALKGVAEPQRLYAVKSRQDDG